jgi:hypothetical protein
MLELGGKLIYMCQLLAFKHIKMVISLFCFIQFVQAVSLLRAIEV